MQFNNGTMGAINGMCPNGKIDTTYLQSREVWTGKTYAVVVIIFPLGLKEEAFLIAKGIYEMTYNELNY